MLNLIIDSTVPLVALLLVGYISYNCYKAIMALQVVGKPNEWVVVINNGKQVQAGIGLSLFRGFSDQVAIFPSKVNKVQFTTNQITDEMQGLEVSAMLVWTIHREGDGPMKAFKNLGQDLTADTPTIANNLIISMASAIVRNCIANSTIDQIIKNRDELKSSIVNQLKTVVTGWGVWLETVEITDVKICSGKLFKDLQCKFREDQNFQATIQKNQVDHEIKLEKEKYAFEKAQRDYETAKQKALVASKRRIVDKEQELQSAAKNNEISLKASKREWEPWVESQKRTVEINAQDLEVEYQAFIQEKQAEIDALKLNLQLTKENNALETAKLTDDKAQERKKKIQELEFQKAEYDAIKEKMKDPLFVANMRQEIVISTYEHAQYSSKFTLNNMEGKDALVMAVDNLIQGQQ